METAGKYDHEKANYHPAFLADVTVEDIESARDRGAFSLRIQENGDGSKQLLICGTGKFSRCIIYRLNVCPEGRVYFDILYYRSIIRDKKLIPKLIGEFEKMIKGGGKAVI